jgi:aspartate dehydrogenase
MRVGIIGGGVIARLVLEHVRRGALDGVEVVAVVGRSESSRGAPLAREFSVAFATDLGGLLAAQPETVIEAASHQAVHDWGEALLAKGISFVALSAGALCDDALRARLERAAQAGGALLYVPSGGIGGLDALKAAVAAGAQEVTIVVAKPPAAWKGIPYIEERGWDMDALTGAVVLFDGTARDGVPYFPANVNIAALKELGRRVRYGT